MATRCDRGMTLIEVTISMVILLIGMLGLMRFQMAGLTANQGSRAHTTASQLARELAGALEKLPPDDALIAPTGTVGNAPPAPFGPLLDGSTVASSGFRDMSATGVSALRGVTPEAALEHDPADPTRPVYERRWTVWGRNDGGSATPATLVMAVSVVYRERTFPQPREVVLYVNRSNPTAVMGSIAAFE